MDWVKVEAAMPRHPRVGRLSRALGVPRYAAAGVLVTLWTWAAELWGEEGRFRCQPDEVADAVWWEGDPEQLLEALESTGWLRRDGDYWVIVGWDEHQTKQARARLFARERKRRQREREKVAEGESQEGENTQVCASRKQCHAPVTLVSRSTPPPSAPPSSSPPYPPNNSPHSIPPLDETSPSFVRTPQDGEVLVDEPALPLADLPQPPPSPRRKATPDHRQLLKLWGEKCPNLPQPQKWTNKRQQAWAARCREDGFLAALPAVIDRIAASDYCNGRIDPGPGHSKPFMAHIDWLLQPDTWVRVLEGRYDNRGTGIQTEKQDKLAVLRTKIRRLEAAIKRTKQDSLRQQLQQDLKELRAKLAKEEKA